MTKIYSFFGLLLCFTLFSCGQDLSIDKDLIKEHGLKLELSDSSFQAVCNVRDIALKKNQLTDKSTYVSGQMICGEVRIPVKVRLKGDHTDHLEGNRWSFRVKTTKKGLIMGERKFSIQGAYTRGYMNEWVFHQLLKENEILHLQYEFIPFSINDIDSLKGIYAFESHFRSEILALQDAEAGPIMKFNEDVFWDLKYLRGNADRESIVYNKSEIELTNKRGFSNREGELAIKKLKEFRLGSAPLHSVFNVKKWATFVALNGLLASNHALRWHNLRLYYNPESKLIEPIGFDCGTWFNKKGAWFLNGNEMDEFYHKFYDDPEFIAHLKSETARFAEKDYLKKWFRANKIELEERAKLLEKDYPNYKFWKESFLNVQTILREELIKNESSE